MAEFTEVETALTYIDSTNRETWVRVGTALKTEFGEQGFEMFDTWSKTAKNYNAGAVKSAWKSFQIGKSNIGYVFNRAKENGFVRQNVKPMSAAEIAERERRNAELAKKAEKERQEKAFEAARMANYIWAKSTTAIPLNHGYLQKKGISDPAVLKSIRYNPRFKTLVIPLKNKGHIVGLQFINADGSKNFNADIEKKGSAITIGNRDDMVNGFFVAEGFATAASIVQATGKPCIMAIDAGNLPIVAENLKTFVSNNNVPVVFCTDKDADGKGEKYAKQAAAILGKQAKVITPDFTETETALWQAKNDGKKPTDFNDLQQIGGVERVASVLSGSLTAVVNPENKLLINVYGSPATGKSYTAENLAAQFRAIGIECELVTEYATELIKAGRQDELKDQVKVTGEQLRREQAAFNHANIVITDSPTRLGIIYAPDEQKAALHDIAEQSDKIPHINILLRHNSESLATFSMNGRIHGKEESLAIQDELIEMMKGKYPIHHERSIPLEEVINRIGETQEWQNFAEKHNVELTRFSIDMDGTFSGSIESVENDTLTVSQTSELSTMNEEMPKPERSAWGDFPPVIRNGDIGELKNEPEYEQAKAGDIVAAGELVNRLIKRETLEQIQTMIGDRKPIVVAVVAEEATGNNAIPRATAQAIGRELGLFVDTNIRQVNKVARTGKTIDHRLAFQPAFGGEVQQGKDYLIVDDTLAAGGTIASLKGYIENRGGKVVGAMAMTARESSLVLPVTQKMLDNIQRNHGNAMNEFWQKEFGYGIDKLTNGEAGHLRKAENVEQIRTRIANAKAQGGFSVSEQTLPKADIQSPNGEKNELTDDEIPRPPQGGFVLPDENRQPEQINPKENPMAELNEDKQMLMQMLDANRAVSFRQTAAASELADDEVLRKAFQDTDESVRLAAVRNPNASSEFLQDAFNDAYPNEKAEI
ncbi:MAG: PriCT-2 domain-containing protein, partial [Neisseriaceae bacterium]|nr:PriCT-2 domain-containing protein [Neisseriaceae bacterium]